MKVNKKISKLKHPINHYKQPFAHRSQKIVHTIVSQIQLAVANSIQLLERQKYLQRNLKHYAYIFYLINFQDFFHSQLGSVPQTAIFSCDQQPKAIQIDSLCCPSLQKQSSKMSLPSIKQSRISQKSTSSSLKGSSLGKYKSQSLKLKLQPIEEMKSISQLRQLKMNQESELMRKKQEEQDEKKRGARVQALNIDVSFDYNGSKLFKNSRVQSNLVQNLLSLKLKNAVVTRKKELPPQPQTLEGLKIEKSKPKKNKDEQTGSQFTTFVDSQSLADNVEISRGIRYSHNALVYEQKKVALEPAELKSRLGKRKLSKHEFLKVSQLVDKTNESRLKKFKTEQQSELGSFHKRAYSEINLSSSPLRRRQVINIINPQLRESMLIRLADYQSFLLIEKQLPPEKCQQQSQHDGREEQLTVISGLNNQEMSSRASQSRSETPKLPAIKSRSVRAVDADELVITQLGNQLRQKM